MKPASARSAVEEAADTAVAVAVDMAAVAVAAAADTEEVVEAAATAAAVMATAAIADRGDTRVRLLHIDRPQLSQICSSHANAGSKLLPAILDGVCSHRNRDQIWSRLKATLFIFQRRLCHTSS